MRIAPRHNPTAAPARRRSGTILIVTLWIVLVLAGMTLVLARAMRVEAICSANDYSAMQAAAVEQGAIQYVLSYVDSYRTELPDSTEMPCEAIQVGNGAFWILRPNFDNDRQYDFGLVDEASKLNINTATPDMLLKLCTLLNASTELPANIVTWRSNLTTSAGAVGVGDEYYLTLPDPYYCKHERFETLDELLLVKEMTRAILYGEDANHNYMLDDNENDGDQSAPDDDRDGKLNRGFSAYTTVYSNETRSAAPFRSKIHVNFNTASDDVLYCLGLTTDQAALVLAKRAESSTPLSTSEWRTWATQSLPSVGLDVMGYISGECYRFSADIVSVSGDGRSFRHCRIVVDNNATPAKVIYRQDLTYMGWPLETTILEKLRSGVSVANLPKQSALQESR